MRKVMRAFWVIILLLGILITFANFTTLKLESRPGYQGARLYIGGAFECGDDGYDCNI